MIQEAPKSSFHYSGTGNLEAMEEAKRYNVFLVEQILKHAPRSGAALDFGAGVGTFAKAIRERGIQVLCVEPDAKQRAAIAQLGLACFPRLADIQGPVAYVYTLNVLEHIDDDETVLAEIAEKLAPAGRLFLYVPAFAMLYGPMDRLVGHVRRYERTDLARKVTSAGLKVVRCEYVDCLGFAATLVFNRLGRNDGHLDGRAVRLYDRIVFPLSRVMDGLCSTTVGKNLLLVAEKSR